MYTNQIWTLVDLPEMIKLIGCKQVFKRNTNMKDNVQTYKARLVAKVYRKKQRVETFSLVAMLKSVRIQIAIATYHDYKI